MSRLYSMPLAFGFAYALTRSCMPSKGLFRAIALIPLLAPSLLSAISLIYWFGNQGVLKRWLTALGIAQIYGAPGIVLAEIVSVFPHTLMILITALALSDARLYEAAESMGTRPWRRFMTITLPGAKYGLVSAAMVVFMVDVRDGIVPLDEDVAIRLRKINKPVVKIITLKSAKGLEFPIVALAGFIDGAFPVIPKGTPEEAVEEIMTRERRTLYVGMTRARERLTLVYCRSRTLFGSRNSNPPSIFLAEIPADVVEHGCDMDVLVGVDSAGDPAGFRWHRGHVRSSLSYG